jgi:hypothetical protein
LERKIDVGINDQRLKQGATSVVQKPQPNIVPSAEAKIPRDGKKNDPVTFLQRGAKALNGIMGERRCQNQRTHLLGIPAKGFELVTRAVIVDHAQANTCRVYQAVDVSKTELGCVVVEENYPIVDHRPENSRRTDPALCERHDISTTSSARPLDSCHAGRFQK